MKKNERKRLLKAIMLNGTRYAVKTVEGTNLSCSFCDLRDECDEMDDMNGGLLVNLCVHSGFDKDGGNACFVKEEKS